MHGAAKLGGVLLIDFATCFRRIPVMATPIAVERTEQAPGNNHIAYPPEAAERTFFFNKEHRVVPACSIIHGDDQIPLLPKYPLVGATVLVDHHARQRRPFPSFPVGTALLGFRNQPCFLKTLFDPGVAAHPATATATRQMSRYKTGQLRNLQQSC